MELKDVISSLVTILIPIIMLYLPLNASIKVMITSSMTGLLVGLFSYLVKKFKLFNTYKIRYERGYEYNHMAAIIKKSGVHYTENYSENSIVELITSDPLHIKGCVLQAAEEEKKLYITVTSKDYDTLKTFTQDIRVRDMSTEGVYVWEYTKTPHYISINKVYALLIKYMSTRTKCGGISVHVSPYGSEIEYSADSVNSNVIETADYGNIATSHVEKLTTKPGSKKDDDVGVVQLNGFYLKSSLGASATREFIKHLLTNTDTTVTNMQLILDKDLNLQWIPNDTKFVRHVDNSFLTESVRQELFEDIRHYDSMHDKIISIGGNFKRSYVLHGPPGTGKSCIPVITSKLLDCPIIHLNIGLIRTTDKFTQTIQKLYETIVPSDRHIIVIDDMDKSLFFKGLMTVGTPGTTDAAQESGVTDSSTTLVTVKQNTTLDVTVLLNWLDGVNTAGHSRILFVTINNNEFMQKMDDSTDGAFFRTGRFDKKIHVGYADRLQFTDFYRYVFEQEPREKVVTYVTQGCVTISELQNYAVKSAFVASKFDSLLLGSSDDRMEAVHHAHAE